MKHTNIISQLWQKLPGLSKHRSVPPRKGRCLSYLDDDAQSMQKLFGRITAYMEEEHPYLYGDFSIGDLSKRMFTNQTRVSKTVNRLSGRNFKGFLNEYRVKHAAELIGKDPRMKMEEVARLSGFNTLPTFNSAFKSIMNERPSEYQARVHRR